MTWSSLLLALLAAHVVGDVLVQTEWEAINKRGGLTGSGSLRALLLHVTTYTLSFVPVAVWVANDRSVARALLALVLVAIPHLLVDDGRPVTVWITRVKHAPLPAPALSIAVDQSFHVVSLLAVALILA